MHPVHFVEIASVLVLGLFTILELRRGTARDLAPLALTLVVSSLIAEDTCIRWYGFYGYRPEWHGIIDQMPLMVALIWPFVILSDQRVVAALVGEGDRRLPLFTGLWVAWDACLMESIAVKAGLWSWTEPGLFDVPLIGVLGWGMFATSALWLWQRLPRRLRPATVVLAPLLTHALLLASWWGGLRWVLRGPFPPEAVVAVGAIVGAALSFIFYHKDLKVDIAVMGPRILAASVFGFLLVWKGREDVWLMAFVATFVLPYLVLTDWRTLRAGISGGR